MIYYVIIMRLPRAYIALCILVTFFLPGCAYHHEVVKLPEEPLYNQTEVFNNIQYVPLLRFCSYYNLDWSWDLVSQKIEIKRGQNELILRPNSRYALLNGKSVKLTNPIAYRSGAAYIPVKSAMMISRDIFTLEPKPQPEAIRYRIETVVIDPGHGGKDPGATSRFGVREKDLVLDVSKRLKRQLQKAGVNATMTRNKDIFIPLTKRAKIANDKNADLFISVHANAARYSRARGFEVFYLSEATDDKARAMAAAENASLEFEEKKNMKEKDISTKTTVWDLKLKESRRESKELAYYICNITSDGLGMKKRGVKGARFVVLKGATMPAVLVEIGFITNKREASKLKKSNFREKIAKAVSDSILTYKKEYERTNGFSE